VAIWEGYAYDSSFLDYFGSNGVAEVEKTIKILNDVPAYSRLSSQLTEYQLEARRDNYQAQALGLLDLKSYALSLVVEQLGLASPERYTWTLRARFPLPNTQCPVMNYAVIQRNFDPVTFEPTPYVNGVLYTYQIFEACQGTPFLADAVEVQVDPLAVSFNSVAGLNLPLGGFFTGLTRDDVGGLRYIYRKSNFNTEGLPINATAGGGGGAVITTIDSPWNVIFPTNVTATNVPGVPTVTVSNIALRAGVDKVTFTRSDFDSQLGSFFVGFTNSYNLTTLVNSRQRSERITRAVVAPDLVFAAADIGVVNPAAFAVASLRTAPAYLDTGPPGLNGPGTLPGPVRLTFNKLGRVRVNMGPAFIDEASAFLDFNWGSFDGTTNAPIIYPFGTSIMNLEEQILQP
jgi:hypothetical protein